MKNGTEQVVHPSEEFEFNLSDIASLAYTYQPLNLFDMIYPIGSIYVSINSTSPEKIFGGKWQQITDRFLYCSNSGLETGGSKTITGANLPSHSHYIDLNTQDSGWHNHSAYNRGWNSVSNRDSPNVQVMSRYELSGDPQDWNSGIGIGYAGTHNHRITCHLT